MELEMFNEINITNHGVEGLVPKIEDFIDKNDIIGKVNSFEDADKPLKDYTTEDIERISSRNEELEGESHPETGVKFNAKVVENEEGNLVEVVAPEFDSKFDAQLPEDLYDASDRAQFKECNKQLNEAIDKEFELENKFSSEQLEQIADGKTPNGYTWHHDVEQGKVQLVDSDTHAKTGHTGGKSVWGGGSENR